MFCPNCGTSNVDDAAFCSNCGESLSRRVVESPPRYLLAGRGTRLAAKFIDTAVYVVGIIAVVIFFLINDVLGVLSLLALLAVPILQVVLLSKDGQTTGKKALNIRIVMVNTSRNGRIPSKRCASSMAYGFVGRHPFLRAYRCAIHFQGRPTMHSRPDSGDVCN